MSILSTIAIGAAFANYRKAKAEYDDAVAEEKAIMAAINASSAYEDERSEKYAELLKQGEAGDPNSHPSAIMVSALVRVGNLAPVAGIVGDNFRANVTLVFTNTSSDRSFIIRDVKAQASIFGEQMYSNELVSRFTLDPGQVMELELPGVITKLNAATQQKLVNMICEACGKKLITSCGKINIENIGGTDVEFKYGSGTTYAGDTRAIYNRTEVGTVVRYCGEAFYPKA